MEILLFYFVLLTLTTFGAAFSLQKKTVGSSLILRDQAKSVDWQGDKSIGGIKFHKKFTVTSSTDGGIRGIVAKENIEANSLVLSVPEDQAIETANNRPPTPFKDFVSQVLWEDSKWDQRICYKLLWEIVLGKESTKYLWIQQLPESYSTPFYWTEKELAELQYDSLTRKVVSQRYAYNILCNKHIISRV